MSCRSPHQGQSARPARRPSPRPPVVRFQVAELRPLLTISELAELLGVTRDTIYRYRTTRGGVPIGKHTVRPVTVLGGRDRYSTEQVLDAIRGDEWR